MAEDERYGRKPARERDEVPRARAGPAEADGVHRVARPGRDRDERDRPGIVEPEAVHRRGQLQAPEPVRLPAVRRHTGVRVGEVERDEPAARGTGGRPYRLVVRARLHVPAVEQLRGEPVEVDHPARADHRPRDAVGVQPGQRIPLWDKASVEVEDATGTHCS